MKNKVTNFIVIVFMFIFGAVISVVLMDFLAAGGLYPSGSDTMYHIFRGDVIYKSFNRQMSIPLYSRLMYNGIELFRYQTPLSPVLFAVCEFAAGGNVFSAYLYYVSCIFCLGLAAWTIIGMLRKRPVTGLLFGIIWFFLPNNIYTLFVEGNIAKSLAYVFLPLLFYSAYQFLENGYWVHILGVVLALFLMIQSNYEFAKMTTVGTVVFLVIFRIFQKKRRRIAKVIAGIVASFLLSGMFLVPYIKGNIAAEGEEYAAGFFQSILVTLNPVLRMTKSPELAYFGLSLFIIAILGALASNKSSAPGFITAIIIVLLTAASAYVVISIVPGSELLLMLRFLSIALALVLIGVLYWDKLRKWVLILFIVLICADCVPSFYWIIGQQNNRAPQSRYIKESEDTLIKEAKELCVQRIALFDLSSLGAEGAFLISDFGGENMSVFGSGWQYSATSGNTKRLNSAMSDEYFAYLFDRCIELGADTIIIQKAQATYGERTLVKLDKAAESLGYDIIDENEGYMLYHLNVDGTYGTKAKYDAIGIGYSAYSLSLAFPNIKETGDYYIDHYSYEYLSQFKTVYLSGFFYEDRARAEDMVKTLSENGVRIVILADGMPEDRETRSKTFLGVTCNVVQFENGYPILYTRDFGEMDCDLFPRGYSKWVTYYLNGLQNVGGTISDNNVELAFFGTGLNDNICYIGLNIPFYYYLTQDTNAEKLMQWVMGMEPGILPEREIYPISINYGTNEITVDSNVDYINTGLAYHDCFNSEQSIFVDNGLLITRSGMTKIRIVYPYLVESILVTALGLLLLTVLLWYVRRSDLVDRGIIKAKEKKEEQKETEEKEYYYPELKELEEKEETEEEETGEDETKEPVEAEEAEGNEEKKEVIAEAEEKQEEKIIEKETEKNIQEEEPENESEEISEKEPWKLAETKSEKGTAKDFDIPMKTGDDFDIPFGN